MKEYVYDRGNAEKYLESIGKKMTPYMDSVLKFVSGWSAFIYEMAQIGTMLFEAAPFLPEAEEGQP